MLLSEIIVVIAPGKLVDSRFVSWSENISTLTGVVFILEEVVATVELFAASRDSGLG